MAEGMMDGFGTQGMTPDPSTGQTTTKDVAKAPGQVLGDPARRKPKRFRDWRKNKEKNSENQ